VARKAPARARHALFDLVDPRILRAKIGAEERLGYLLGHVLPERVAGTEALSVQLGSRDPAEQLASDDDLAFLEARREELSRLLLEALERDRSAWAALLLGQLKDERALPLLRDAFLDVHDFWGWETSRPCPLEERQYPVRHAFEQAILHITGKPLAAVLQITTPEIWSCARKPDGLYVLFRLKPEAALEMAASRFRKDPRDPNQCCSRLELADALAEHLLRPGLSSGHLRVLLGRPARIAGETWRYAVGETTTPLELELRFAKGLLVSSGVVAAEKVP
jgi:hypothetical protein